MNSRFLAALAWTLTLLCAWACPAAAQQEGAPASTQAADPATQTFAAQSHCPIDAQPLAADLQASEVDADGVAQALHFDYEGQRVRVCSLRCRALASAEAEFTLARMERDGVAPLSVNQICPITGEQLEDREHIVWSGNKSFAVCCQKCARKASANPAAALDTLAGRSTKQTVCLISGKKLRGRNQLLVDGYRVRVCSEECIKHLQALQDRFWPMLAQAKVVLEPLKRQCAVDPSKKGKLTLFVTLPGRRVYFHSAKARWAYLEPHLVTKEAEEGAGGALDFLGGSLGGGH